MTDNQTPTYENAESLRKSKRYPEACEQFAQLWRQNPSSLVGWRHAFCLRKMGRLDEAEEVAKEAMAKYPEDEYTRSELVWILYERELKPAQAGNDLGRAVHAANRILALNPGQMALTRVVLTVLKVAKARDDWKLYLEWADRLTPESLSSEPMAVGGKRGMSERETWYIGRARALIELGRFDEARRFAQSGLVEFSDDIFLRRIAALSLAGLGDLAGAISEMRSLLSHPRADWYMYGDLAELEYRAGNLEEAYRLMCEALFTSRQSEEFKLKYFVIMARLALTLGKIDIAAAHIALAKTIRANQGWTIPPELVQVEQDILAALKASGQSWPKLPQDSKQLGRLCRHHWQEGRDEGVQFYRGTIKPYPEGRPFAHIKRDDGGEDVFVLVRDLPEDCRRPGSRVEFALKRSYDKKKQRESVQATRVRCFRG